MLVYVINGGNKFLWLIGANNIIEILNDDVNHCCFSFLISITFLASDKFIADKCGHKDIENLFKLNIGLNPGVTPNKLDLFLKLLKIDVGAPANSNEYPDSTPIARDCLVYIKSVTHQGEEDKHEY